MSHVNNERSESETFPARFEALTGYTPLRWQKRLFEQMLSGTIPSACDLPTGLGKTSVIPIWLIALASPAPNSTVKLPRRLVYIVNRRTVVDQATDVVERMRRRLQNPQDERWINHKDSLHALNSRLWALSAVAKKDASFGVSTLRGEMADNEEWKADPGRPAIIVGTIDMVGSKLLFSGYGDGRYHRTHHAGLIGQDVLIVHDEAHLTPAFGDLLRSVANAQRCDCEPRPIRVMELSATRRGGDNEEDVLRLEAEDEQDPIVIERLDASKHLLFHEVAETDVIAKLVDCAMLHDRTASKVLIYVRLPDHAQQVAGQLKAKLGSGADNRVALLTGTVRGYERDQLIQNPPTSMAGRIVRLFLDGVKPEHTVYLVSTSAGEVGIDLDADHMLCDLTTMDSMIQRLGRVNRRGGSGRVALVEVVIATKDEEDRKKESEVTLAIQATHRIVLGWIGKRDKVNVGPRNLRDLVAKLSDDERTSAFSPKPMTPPLTDILLDAWSLTSVDYLPGRPEVAAYLHGLTHDPPETYVAWRKEVTLFDQAQVSQEALCDWFRASRIEACERLRDRTDRVKKVLADLLKARSRKLKLESYDFPVIVLNERGGAEWCHLSKVVGDDFRLAYRTIVLPVEAGGLDEHGMLTANLDEVLDCAEITSPGDRRERWLSIRNGGEYQRILTGQTLASLPEGLREEERICLRQPSEDGEQESESCDLMLLASASEAALENPETARFRQTLTEHTDSIVSYVGGIADCLGLESSIKSALVVAAKWHDRGKNCAIWQRYACNTNRAEPLAKSRNYLHGSVLRGYRHEFSSILEADGCEELRSHAERDLVLHLVAAHHGRARPHFDPHAFDNEKFTTADNERAAVEVMRRFGRLQQRFGRWGLAWLESLLRCADIAASRLTASEEANVPSKQEFPV